MTRCGRSGVVGLCIAGFMVSVGLAADRLPRLAPGVENLLVRAKTSGNLNSFGKGLYDASTLSSIISMRLDLGWIKGVENVTVAGPDGQYTWTRSDDPNAVHVIREIDQQAMQRDLFDTMKDKPTRLIGVSAP